MAVGHAGRKCGFLVPGFVPGSGRWLRSIWLWCRARARHQIEVAPEQPEQLRSSAGAASEQRRSSPGEAPEQPEQLRRCSGAAGFGAGTVPGAAPEQPILVPAPKTVLVPGTKKPHFLPAWFFLTGVILFPLP